MNTNYKHNSVKAQKATNCIVYFADTYHISYQMSFKIKFYRFYRKGNLKQKSFR